MYQPVRQTLQRAMDYTTTVLLHVLLMQTTHISHDQTRNAAVFATVIFVGVYGTVLTSICAPIKFLVEYAELIGDWPRLLKSANQTPKQV